MNKLIWIYILGILAVLLISIVIFWIDEQEEIERAMAFDYCNRLSRFPDEKLPEKCRFIEGGSR